MPRKPRVYLDGVPCHVVQRGNNRQTCFFAEEDYQFYLECLFDSCCRYRVDLHAFVLMTNHVHLLLTPNNAEGISKVMQSIGRRYVQNINHQYKRSGTLWEGRHKSSLVDVEHYLLHCYRYIEMNPVRAGMVKHPADYKWSSFMANAHNEDSYPLAPHPLYTALGQDSALRQEAYRELFSTDLERAEIHAIRTASQCSMPVGDSRFKEEIEQLIGRSLGNSVRGRPRIREEGAVYIVWE